MIDKRKVITENLKNWYAIDSILLNDHVVYKIQEGKAFKEYVSIKAALLSTLFEYYKHVGFNPTSDIKYKTSRVLQEHAVDIAKRGKSLAADMIQKEAFKSEIKAFIIKEAKNRKITDMKKFSSRVITERFLRMCLDNVLIGLPLLESKTPENARDFKGEILEEAYRMTRNSLIHIARTSKLLSVGESKVVKEGLRKTVMSILGIPMIGLGGMALYRIVRSFMDAGTRRCGVLAINTTARQACMLKVKLQTLSKMLQYANKQKDAKMVAKVQQKIAKAKMALDKATNLLARKGKTAKTAANKVRIV